jgi:hypothetical protein
VILLDTSGLLAALFADQKHHEECANVLRETEGALILSPFVLAEAASVIRRHAGADAELMFVEEVARGAYQLAPFEAHELPAARHAAAKYKIGLVGASLLVLGERHGCRKVLTLNRKFPNRFRRVPDL